MSYEPGYPITQDIDSCCVGPMDTIRRVIECMDLTKRGIALVVGPVRKLVGTVTEGEIRRTVLGQFDLTAPVSTMLDAKRGTPFATPLTAPFGTPGATLLQLMRGRKLKHVPLVDPGGMIVDLIGMEDLFPQELLPVRAVIMAGGEGNRLRPLTHEVPKPMLPIGERPLLEIIVEQLRQAGVHQVNLTTRYKGNLISDHFGDGAGFGVDIKYVNEDQPLGTVGALSRLAPSEGTLLVINGDILTNVDFRAMVDYHNDNQADMTVGVRLHEFEIPYGVVETSGISVTGMSEKPVIRHFINAGIYLITAEASRLVPDDRSYDIPDLIGQLLADGRRVVSFPIHEYWRDIGNEAEYRQAQQDLQSGKVGS